jgi:hypothetical protein
MGDDIKTVLKDITNGRLRRCVDFPNQTFFGLIADDK